VSATFTRHQAGFGSLRIPKSLYSAARTAVATVAYQFLLQAGQKRAVHQHHSKAIEPNRRLILIEHESRTYRLALIARFAKRTVYMFL
jgi:hypothetical protein